MTEEEKKYYLEAAKSYRLIAKFTLVLALAPVLLLIYEFTKLENKEGAISYSDASGLLINLLIPIGFLVAIYVAYMSLQMKAEIFKEIVNKPNLEELSKPENGPRKFKYLGFFFKKFRR